MATRPPLSQERSIRTALAALAYERDCIRVADGDLGGADCIVATPRGLHAVSRDGLARCLVHGYFFGVRRHAGQLYVFEACDRPAAPTDRGRIVRFTLSAGRLDGGEVLVKGLSNGCHQVGVFDGMLHVVDTPGQSILRFALDGAPLDRIEPLPRAHRNDGSPEYRHVNGIARIGSRMALMLHNGTWPDRPSELARFDADWREVARETLPGHGCHDVVEDGAGTLWHCGSLAGEIINSRGDRHCISDRMTRGLAVTGDGFIVGLSLFGPRMSRDRRDGAVLYLDRALRPLAEVVVPGPPTDLVAI